MAYGLKIWNGAGQLRLDTSDRLPKYVASFSGKGYANYGTWSKRLYGESASGYYTTHYVHYFYVNYPGITNDGTWDAVITSLSDPIASSGIAPPEYQTGYCVMEVGRIKMVVQTLRTEYYSEPDSEKYGYPNRRQLTYSLDLYRV